MPNMCAFCFSPKIKIKTKGKVKYTSGILPNLYNMMLKEIGLLLSSTKEVIYSSKKLG